jgi:hypothetical protein
VEVFAAGEAAGRHGTHEGAGNLCVLESCLEVFDVLFERVLADVPDVFDADRPPAGTGA